MRCVLDVGVDQNGTARAANGAVGSDVELVVRDEEIAKRARSLPLTAWFEPHERKIDFPNQEIYVPIILITLAESSPIIPTSFAHPGAKANLAVLHLSSQIHALRETLRATLSIVLDM